MKNILHVLPDDAGKRLDRVLAAMDPALSRNKIAHLIRHGHVLVNGTQKKASYLLKGGDQIHMRLIDEKETLKPYDFPVKIMYEDTDVIVLEKPEGLVVHPPQAGYTQTLVNVLIGMEKELSSISPLRPGIVHRLDKQTSGVMVVAKNNRAHLQLVAQFRERAIQKEYRALCWGTLAQERIVVDMPVRRDDKQRLKMKISFVNAKHAYSEVRRLTALNEAVLVGVKLHTGRMHQIRVHLTFLGCPIVGDTKYGIKDQYDHLFLHSHRLGFRQPLTGEWKEFTSPVPQYFDDFINEHS